MFHPSQARLARWAEANPAYVSSTQTSIWMMKSLRLPGLPGLIVGPLLLRSGRALKRAQNLKVVDYFFTDDLDHPLVRNRKEQTHG